jgi:hypothetical protein
MATNVAAATIRNNGGGTFAALPKFTNTFGNNSTSRIRTIRKTEGVG